MTRAMAARPTTRARARRSRADEAGVSEARPEEARPEEARPEPTGWGRLAPHALVAAAGLAMMSLGYALATSDTTTAEALYWVSFVVIAAPIVLRLAGPEASTRERVGLVILLGLALLIARLLRSPDAFTGFDELLHYRTLADILSTGHLFDDNPLLKVSPRYPGLELLTAAVVQVSGADVFGAATIVLCATRVLFVVGLFGLYREASGSDRVAGLAAGLYMLNPSFTFFDGSFGYESLAVSLVPSILLGVAVAARTGRRTIVVVLLLLIAALVITHHVTALGTAGILLGWLAVRLVLGRRDRYALKPVTGAAFVLGLAALAWLTLVAPATLRYLSAPFSGAFAEILKLLESGQGRVLFQSATGQLASIWERVIALGIAGVLTAAIPVGLVALWRALRNSSLALLLGLLSLGYPLGLVGRLLPTGSEAASRSLALIFIGVAFVISIAIVQLLEEGPGVFFARVPPLQRIVILAARRVPRAAWQTTFAVLVAAMAIAGIALGTAPASRLPGPYLPSADARSIDPQSLGMVDWFGSTFGPGERVAADRVNRLLLGSYGEAQVIFPGSEGVELWQVFLSPTVGDAEIARLREAKVRYIVIDRRLSTGLPLVQIYYEEGEVFEGPHKVPISPDVLAKWDSVPGVDRIFDSGAIQVYDVRRLSGAEART